LAYDSCRNEETPRCSLVDHPGQRVPGREQATAAEETAGRLGGDVEILYADNDSIQQSQQILKFVPPETKSRRDGIILEPVGGTGLRQESWPRP
jgi:hypothetical protein